MDAKLNEALRLAAALEAKNQYEAAIEVYRKTIAAAEDADRTLVGMMYINLGNAQRLVPLVDEAIASYQSSIESLDGQKGEAILQRGYAFLNMAGQLLIKDDPRAVAAAAESLRIHRAYPYTTATDLADAAAQHFVARLFIEKKADEAGFRSTWREVKAAPCAELVRSVAFNFVLNYLMFMKKAYPDEYPAVRGEVEEWASPDFFAEAVAHAEGSIGMLRLQRALFGIPDPDGF